MELSKVGIEGFEVGVFARVGSDPQGVAGEENGDHEQAEGDGFGPAVALGADKGGAARGTQVRGLLDAVATHAAQESGADEGVEDQAGGDEDQAERPEEEQDGEADQGGDGAGTEERIVLPLQRRGTPR